MEVVDALALHRAALVLRKYNRDEKLADQLYEIARETINLDAIYDV